MNKPLTNEQILRMVEVNMQTEGFTVSEKAKKDGLALLAGKTTANDLVQQYIQKLQK